MAENQSKSMERVGQVSKNAAALVFARIVTSLLTFGLAIIINRDLGPELAGVYNYALVLYTIFMVIPDFGLGNISIRDVSQENSRMHRYLTNIVSMRVILGLIAFSLLMITNFTTLAFQADSALATEKFWVVFAISFSLMIEQPLSNSLAENFIALERLVLVAFVYLIMGIAKVVLSIYVIMGEFNHVLVYLILIYILTYIYSIFHFYVAYRRIRRKEEREPSDMREVAVAEAVIHKPEVSDDAKLEALLADYSYAGLTEGEDIEAEAALLPTAAPVIDIEIPPQKEEDTHKIGPFRIERDLWRYLLVSAWPLAVVAAAVTIYAGMDIPLLSWIKGDAEVGLYYAAGMFAKALVFFTLAINMAILPAVSKVGGKFPERLGEVWERLVRYAWILVIPLVVLAPVLARPFLIFQEHQFIEAWPATWLTMGAMNFTFMTAISFPFFIVLNKQKMITWVVIAGLGLKVAMDLITIPLWGYMGAAITVCISEFVVLVVLFRILARELRHHVNVARFAGVPLLCLGGLYAVAFVLQWVFVAGKDTTAEAAVAALIVAAILTILYIVMVLVARLITRKGLHELNDLLTVE